MAKHNFVLLKDVYGGDDVVFGTNNHHGNISISTDFNEVIQLSVPEARKMISALNIAVDGVDKPKAGDVIRVFASTWMYEEVNEYTLEEFRHTLGFFRSEQHRTAGEFTPLSDDFLYDSGPESRSEYISNFGSYTSNLVAIFDIIRSK